MYTVLVQYVYSTNCKVCSSNIYLATRYIKLCVWPANWHNTVHVLSSAFSYDPSVTIWKNLCDPVAAKNKSDVKTSWIFEHCNPLKSSLGSHFSQLVTL